MAKETVKTYINWKAVRKELDSQPWAKHEAGGSFREVFIGTVFGWYPSGKYYTPFAHSNVEICNACEDRMAPCTEEFPCKWNNNPEKDGCCEACKDEEWRVNAEEEAEDRGLYLTSGEGDPCDLFIGEWKEEDEDGDEEE